VKADQLADVRESVAKARTTDLNIVRHYEDARITVPVNRPSQPIPERQTFMPRNERDRAQFANVEMVEQIRQRRKQRCTI
jgi:hypothetical protein